MHVMLINRIQLIMVFILAALALLWSITGFAVSPSELEKLTSQQAFEKGKSLHWQYKDEEARPYLKYAADKGNADASLWYGLIKYSGTPSLGGKKKDYKYLIQAANLGNRSAMFSLSSFDSPLSAQEKATWRTKALTALKQAQNKNDPEAFYTQAYIAAINNPLGVVDYVNHDALIKSAELGYPLAKYDLAKDYEAGDGTFFIPGNREKEIKRLYKEAAEAGYPPAINKYSTLLKGEGLKEKAFKVRYENLNKGVANSLLFFAEVYGGDKFKVIPIRSRPYSFVTPDEIKAAGLYKAYFSSMNVDVVDSSYKYNYQHYQNILSTMTNDQKAQADKFAQDYLATHTVRAFDGFWQWGVDYGTKPTDE